MRQPCTRACTASWTSSRIRYAMQKGESGMPLPAKRCENENQSNQPNMSKIEWTDQTWNPTTGCDKVSAGCKFCYAEVMSRRLMSMGQEKYQNNFRLTLHPEELKKPYTWKKPRMVFVNSMSDLFHKDVPFEFIDRVFKVMRDNPQHIFQVLTKRSKRMRQYITHHRPGLTPNNVWLGVSVETEDQMNRVRDLICTDCAVAFVSCEPLLGPLPSLREYIGDIDWVIVGGESGRKPRPIDPEWVREIRDMVQNAPPWKKEKTCFFFKQRCGPNKKKSGRLLDGREWNEIPQRQGDTPGASKSC